MKLVPCVLILAASLLFASPARAAEPMAIEGKIALGEVQGRIDHLAIDLARKRLFVAELGNNSVGVVDLAEQKVIRRLSGLREPQGVGYVAATDTLYVANAGDGSVRLFQGADFSPAGQIQLGDDADNIRVDNTADRAYIGFGNGAIAVIDTKNRNKIGEIKLTAHPESFQLDSYGPKIWANVPDDSQVSVLDRRAGQKIGAWPLKSVRSNFPMAFDQDNKQVITVSRRPAKIIAFNAESGTVASQSNACGDADDVFVDGKRKRVYVSCGEGVVDVLDSSLREIGQVRTVPGARTSLFVPALDRLFVAVRAKGGEPAAIWILQPQ